MGKQARRRHGQSRGRSHPNGRTSARSADRIREAAFAEALAPLVPILMAGNPAATPPALTYGLAGALWHSEHNPDWGEAVDVIDLIALGVVAPRCSQERGAFLLLRNAFVDHLGASGRRLFFGAAAKASVEAANRHGSHVADPLMAIHALTAIAQQKPGRGDHRRARALVAEFHRGFAPPWDAERILEPAAPAVVRSFLEEAANPLMAEIDPATPREALLRGVHRRGLGADSNPLVALFDGYDIDESLVGAAPVGDLLLPIGSSAQRVVTCLATMGAQHVDRWLARILTHPALNVRCKLDDPESRISLGRNLRWLARDLGLRRIPMETGDLVVLGRLGTALVKAAMEERSRHLGRPLRPDDHLFPQPGEAGADAATGMTDALRSAGASEALVDLLVEHQLAERDPDTAEGAAVNDAIRRWNMRHPDDRVEGAQYDQMLAVVDAAAAVSTAAHHPETGAALLERIEQDETFLPALTSIDFTTDDLTAADVAAAEEVGRAWAGPRFAAAVRAALTGSGRPPRAVVAALLVAKRLQGLS